MRSLVTGLVLAGGRGQRFGGRDKGLIEVSGRPLIAHVLARFAPQVDTVLISANRHLDRYARYGYPVIADEYGDFPGPLAGVASGLAHCRSPLLAVVPCDAPLLPPNLVQRLHAALERHAAEVALAQVDGVEQPVFALLRAALANSAASALARGERGLLAWYRRQRCVAVAFDDSDAFCNLNTPADCANAGALIERAAAQAAPRVLGVVGYGGSGKTTLLVRVLPRLLARGLRLGVLKHSHHRFDIDYPGKDSYELRAAGAACVMIASAHRTALICERRPASEPELTTLLRDFEDRDLDLVLVEGFRDTRFPKIEVHRRAGEASTPHGLLSVDDDSIIALVTDAEIDAPRSIPRLHIDDIDAIATFIMIHCAQPASAWRRPD